MCGIVAAIGKIDSSTREKMREALEIMKYRGPDGSGVFEDVHMVLAHVRLSIVDLSENGAQPFSDASGRYQLIFVGEIYNHSELRQELAQEYTFKSTVDTEVLMYGLIKYGAKFLSRLNGMWSIIFYDSQTGKVLVSRDRFAIKPLLYAVHTLGVPKTINESVIFDTKDIWRLVQLEIWYGMIQKV